MREFKKGDWRSERKFWGWDERISRNWKAPSLKKKKSSLRIWLKVVSENRRRGLPFFRSRHREHGRKWSFCPHREPPTVEEKPRPRPRVTKPKREKKEERRRDKRGDSFAWMRRNFLLTSHLQELRKRLNSFIYRHWRGVRSLLHLADSIFNILAAPLMRMMPKGVLIFISVGWAFFTYMKVAFHRWHHCDFPLHPLPNLGLCRTGSLSKREKICHSVCPRWFVLFCPGSSLRIFLLPFRWVFKVSFRVCLTELQSNPCRVWKNISLSASSFCLPSVWFFEFPVF